MQTIQSGSYGANIHTRNDGQGFDVYFLYNMGEPTRDFSNGDVSDRKTYKTEKMALKKVEAWITKNTQGE